MKKALPKTFTHLDTSTGTPPTAPRRPWLRLGGGLALLALIATLSLAASRPAHTAGGPIAVSVANTPLATTPTTEPAFQPFQIHLMPSATVNPATGPIATQSFTVPAGKRLVIETVSSAYGSAQTAGGGGNMTLLTTAGGTTTPHFLADTNFAQNRQNLSVRYYADPGSTVTAQAAGFLINGDPPSVVAGDMELSGYYVNMP